MFFHVFVNIFVADSGLCVFNADLVKCLVKSEIRHYCGNNGVVDEAAALLHVSAVYVEDMVACNDPPLVVNAETAVCVSVVGKSCVKTVLNNVLLQNFNMGRACVVIDICSVRLGIYNVSLSAESVKNCLCDIPRRTVCAVQTYPHAAERVHSERDEIADIAVSAGNIVDASANLCARCKRYLGELFAESLKSAVKISFNKLNYGVLHLLAVTVDKLDTVIVIGIVARGDHDSAVETVNTRNICHRGRCGNMEQICVGTRSRESADK